jgi:hypothetical protein
MSADGIATFTMGIGMMVANSHDKAVRTTILVGGDFNLDILNVPTMVSTKAIIPNTIRTPRPVPIPPKIKLNDEDEFEPLVKLSLTVVCEKLDDVVCVGVF